MAIPRWEDFTKAYNDYTTAANTYRTGADLTGADRTAFLQANKGAYGTAYTNLQNTYKGLQADVPFMRMADAAMDWLPQYNQQTLWGMNSSRDQAYNQLVGSQINEMLSGNIDYDTFRDRASLSSVLANQPTNPNATIGNEAGWIQDYLNSQNSLYLGQRGYDQALASLEGLSGDKLARAQSRVNALQKSLGYTQSAFDRNKGLYDRAIANLGGWTGWQDLTGVSDTARQLAMTPEQYAAWNAEKQTTQDTYAQQRDAIRETTRQAAWDENKAAQAELEALSQHQPQLGQNYTTAQFQQWQQDYAAWKTAYDAASARKKAAVSGVSNWTQTADDAIAGLAAPRTVTNQDYFQRNVAPGLVAPPAQPIAAAQNEAPNGLIATTAPPSTNSNLVANWYRNNYGRDPDAEGLAYWTQQLDSGTSPQDVYGAFVASGRDYANNRNLSLDAASAAYSGYQSSDTGRVQDEWIRNILGREPNAVDQMAPWYQQALTDPSGAYASFLQYAGRSDAPTDWLAASQLTAPATTPPPGDTGGTPPPTTPPGTTPPPATPPDTTPPPATTPPPVTTPPTTLPTGLIDIPTQSVSDRINELTSADSSLMQAADGRALKGMQARGLINSSIAEQAREAAVIQQAESIANADANFAQSSNQFNANWANDMYKTGVQFNLDMQKLSAQWSHDDATLAKTQEFTAAQNELQRQMQVLLQQMQTTSQTDQTNLANKINALTTANQLMVDTQKYIADITANPDMDDAAKARLINNQIDAAIMAVRGYSAIYGSDLTALLNFESLRPDGLITPTTDTADDTEQNTGTDSGGA